MEQAECNKAVNLALFSFHRNKIERDINGLWARVMQSTSAEDISELDILEQRLWLIAGDPPTRPKQH